jgi:hypothetical protein
LILQKLIPEISQNRNYFLVFQAYLTLFHV